MFLKPTVLAISLLASLASAWVVEMDKPFIDPFYDKDGGLRLEPALRAALPEKAWSSSHWSSGWLPDICKDIAVDWNHNPWDIDALNVTFSDCGTPWVLCRHKRHLRSEQELFGVSPFYLFFLGGVWGGTQRLTVLPNIVDISDSCPYATVHCVRFKVSLESGLMLTLYQQDLYRPAALDFSRRKRVRCGRHRRQLHHCLG